MPREEINRRSIERNREKSSSLKSCEEDDNEEAKEMRSIPLSF